jgi:DNA repair exonuclease SbcCD ATPase subunit
MNQTDAQQKLTVFRDQLIREKTRQDEARKQLDSLVVACTTLEQQQEILQAALNLLEQSNIVSRDYMKSEIEKLVSQGLRIIFENPYIDFSINFTTKRNQTEAEFIISKGKDGERITGDILYGNGGGVVDIVSISLRIIIMQLLKVQGPLLLDEPGKNISTQYVGNFGKFLTQISKTFNRQIIMITHNEKLAMFANSILEVQQINGISKISECNKE